MTNALEQFISTVAAAIVFVFLVKFYIDYKDGQKALEKLRGEKNEKQISDEEAAVIKKYDAMSDSALSNSSGSIPGADGSTSGQTPKK
jgi:hypothetical protein